MTWRWSILAGYGDVNQPTQTQLSDELSAIKVAGIVTVVGSGNDGRENTADGITFLAANDDVIAAAPWTAPSGPRRLVVTWRPLTFTRPVRT